MVFVYVALGREADPEMLNERVHALLLPDAKTGTWGEIAVKRSAVAGFGAFSDATRTAHIAFRVHRFE